MNWLGRRPLKVLGAGALVSVTLLASGGSAAAPSPHFVDPTAIITNPSRVHFGERVYVAPFARLIAGDNAAESITIGDSADVQDSVLLDATEGSIILGSNAIVAHGASVHGPAGIGETGACPEDVNVTCASFVSFNAAVEGGVVEKDAMVSALSRVGPGVTIPSGFKTIPGKSVDSPAEVALETVPVTDADRAFMGGVIHVNEAFELSYNEMAQERASNVRGINYDPGEMEFNEQRDLPVLHGKRTRDPSFRNRIIGDITLENRKRGLSRHMGRYISLRADEGEPFSVGSVLCMGNRTTFHALEHTHLALGNDGCYGFHSIVHGGPTDFDNITSTGDGFTLGAYSVFFRSTAGDDVTIGYRSLVQQSDLVAGTTVPARTILINDEVAGTVEW